MYRRRFVAASLAAIAVPAAARAQTEPASTTASPASTPGLIEPQNALEQSFLNALNNEALRPAFRRQLLTSQVALAVVSRLPEAPPRQIELRPGVQACLVFTSSARAAQVMGPMAPVLMLTGRQALRRVRGANVIININLAPALTLEPEDVQALLDMPDESIAPPPQIATPPRLAGPTQ
jgi:hypothetical protein